MTWPSFQLSSHAGPQKFKYEAEAISVGQVWIVENRYGHIEYPYRPLVCHLRLFIQSDQPEWK